MCSSERPKTPSTYEQTLLEPNVYGQLPQIVVDSRYGFTIGNPAQFGAGNYPDERQLQGQESVDWVHNGLLIKAGGQVRNIGDKTSLLRIKRGRIRIQILKISFRTRWSIRPMESTMC